MRAVWIVLVAFLLLTVPVAAETATIYFMPAMYMEDFGAGTPRNINSYTITSSAGSSDGTWVLLGSNDQHIFDLLDSRKSISFSAGTPKQFNISNTASYRYYYFYVVSGFTLTSNLDITFEHFASVLPPKEEFTPYFNFTQKRSPYILIFDFSKNDLPDQRMNYTITSSADFGAIQTWYLYGTNDTHILGTDDPSKFTLIDTQTSIAFTGGVTQIFDISSAPPFTHYVIYMRTGFPTTGTLLEYRFHYQPFIPPTPTPTPTPTTVPLEPITTETAFVPPIYTQQDYFYLLATTCLISLLGAVFIRRYEFMFTGSALLAGTATCYIAMGIDTMQSVTLFEAPTYFENGTLVANATYITTNIHVVTGYSEIIIIFSIVVVLMVVNLLRIFSARIVNGRGGDEDE